MAKPTIDYKIPAAFYGRQTDGLAPLMTVNGFVLAESLKGKTYTYQAINPLTGEACTLFRAFKRLEEGNYKKAIEKMDALGLASTGEVIRTQAAARLSNEYEAIEADMDAVFMNILPERGFDVRDGQMGLARHMLRALYERKIGLSEAGVGIGKTMAYIVAALLVKLKKADDRWIRNAYGYTKDFTERTPMPVVISTSSIALQEAIVSDYIPAISKLLMECMVIAHPLRAVVRKGKEHYICDYRLASFANCIEGRQDPLLQKLMDPSACIDLDKAQGLGARAKRMTRVTDKCGSGCPIRDKCRYLSLVNTYMDPYIDFQVCNHNYFLADANRRGKGARPMLPNYQAVIMDEAHKLLPAARQMYGTSISSKEMEAMRGALVKLPFAYGKKKALAWAYYQAAVDSHRDLFKYLARSAAGLARPEDAQDRLKTEIGKHAQTALRALGYNTGRLADALKEDAAGIKNHPGHAGLIHKLELYKKKSDIFLSPQGLVYWLETPLEPNGAACLAAIPKDVGKRLHADIWSKPFPKILTSGTLAVNGGFEYIKAQLGLDGVWDSGMLETTKQAQFNYREQCLLYISEKTPFPAPPDNIGGDAPVDGLEKKYISAVSREVKDLILAAHGHTAVLFTSYRAMGMVMARLKDGQIPYPMFRLGKGEPAALEGFKESGNGVLFAAGPFWEGIDVPGDVLSSLIIVKLPFAAPDPVSEYERSLYGSDEEFKERFIFSDMIIRLKQGIGRLLRKEGDTGVICILDSRMRLGAKYRPKVLAALPDYRVASRIKDVREFLRDKKAGGFFT